MSNCEVLRLRLKTLRKSYIFIKLLLLVLIFMSCSLKLFITSITILVVMSIIILLELYLEYNISQVKAYMSIRGNYILLNKADEADELYSCMTDIQKWIYSEMKGGSIEDAKK